MSAPGVPPAVSPTAGLRVTPGNVLQLRNAVLAEAQLLRDRLRQSSFTGTRLGEPGRDPGSLTAAPEFNAKIDELWARWDGYVRELVAAPGSISAASSASPCAPAGRNIEARG